MEDPDAMTDEAIIRIRAFCTEALSHLGLSVAEADGHLDVEVPPNALDLFDGRPSLRLAFRPEDVDDGVELVVPGSYVLERILAAVRTRGGLGAIRLEPAAQASPSPGLTLANAEARLANSQTLTRAVLLTSFRVSLVTDEDEDRLFGAAIDLATGEKCEIDPRIVLDHAGQKCPIPAEATGNLESAFRAAQSAAMDFAREWADSMQQKIDARLAQETVRLNGYYRDMLTDAMGGDKNLDARKIQKRRDKADAAYDDLNRSYEIAQELLQNHDPTRLFREKLRPLKEQERRLIWGLSSSYPDLAACKREISVLEKAGEIVRRYLDSLSGERLDLQGERQTRLADLRKRAAKWEASSTNPDALAHIEDLSKQLDSEKAQRIAELEEKFRLKVAVHPVSAAIIEYPQARYEYAAITGPLSIAFTSTMDLVSGEVKGPECHSCQGQMPTGYACACGHLACETCHRTCVGCGKDLCSSCVTVTCQTCESPVCQDCVRVCSVCGLTGCKRDVTDCPCCGKPICQAHGQTCAICGERVCRVCRNEKGYCRTCEGLFVSLDSGDAVRQILASNDIMCSGGTWMIGESRDGFVLVRRGLRLHAYVAYKSTGRVRVDRKLGFLESLRAKRLLR